MGRCSHASCTKRPSFNFEGSTTAAYCRQHAVDGMVDVVSKRCSHDSCTKRPSFNFEGRATAAYCKKHVLDGMVDVVSKRCSYGSCTKRSSFNFAGSKKPAYCEQHATDGMVNVRRSRFPYDSCKRKPSLDAEGSEAAAYGQNHTDDAMVNANVRRCTHDSYRKRSGWGVLADGEATACVRHKGEIVGSPMINFGVECNLADYQNVSRWGFDGVQPSHCRDHGPLKGGLVCTVGRARSKNGDRDPSYCEKRGPSFHVKCECLF